MAERQQPPEGRSSERPATHESQRTGDPQQQAHQTGRAEQAKQEARARTSEMKEGAKEKARELGHEAEEHAQRWTSSVGHQAESLARALRVASDSLWTEGEERMASVVSQAAEQVDRMSGYLEDEDPAGMMEDLADLGRRNPGAFLGSAFAMGLAAGRFLRASTPNGGERTYRGSHEERWAGSDVGATAGAYTAPTPTTPSPGGAASISTPPSGEADMSREGPGGTRRRS